MKNIKRCPSSLCYWTGDSLNEGRQHLEEGARANNAGAQAWRCADFVDEGLHHRGVRGADTAHAAALQGTARSARTQGSML